MKNISQSKNIFTFPNDSNKQVFVLAAILILLVFTGYSGAIKNNFVGWDDNEYVVDNKLVRDRKGPDLKEIFSTVVSLNYHPLTVLSLSLNNNECKNCPNNISAKPFILTNIILHALNTILVFVLIFILFRKNLLLAFLVAAVFAVHPMHVESVAWISARKDVLYGFFFLSGLISYTVYTGNTVRKYFWLFLTFILFILSCLSKATAVVFPVVLLLINYIMLPDRKGVNEYTEFKEAFSLRRVLLLLPFFGVSVFFGLIALRLQSGENFMGFFSFIKKPDDVVNIVGQFSALQRFQIASYGFIVYLLKFFFPVNQTPFYPYPALTELSQGNFTVLLWLSLIAVIAITVMVIISVRKTRLIFFSLGFYFLTLALTLQFISVGKAMMAERYTYLSYIGLSVIPAWYITKSSGKIRTGLLIVAGLFVVALTMVTRNQVKIWHDTGALWTKAIDVYPDLELSRSARGKYYYMLSSHEQDPVKKRELEDKALADFRIAIAKRTMTADVYEGTGVILQGRNDFKTALKYLDVAVKLSPEKGRTYYNRAMVHDQLNEKELAINDYETALRLSPEMELEILKNRSVLLIETGRYDRAVRDLDELIRIDGRDYTNYYNRAFCKVMLKDYEGAIIDYKIVLLLNPGDKATREQLRLLQERVKK